MRFTTGAFFGQLGRYYVLLRLDFDHGSHRGLNLVSGDFFETHDRDPNRFNASFRSTNVKLDKKSGTLKATLSVKGSRRHPPWSMTGKLKCRLDGDKLRARITLFEEGHQYGKYVGVLDKDSDHLRTLRCEVDHIDSLDNWAGLHEIWPRVKTELGKARIELIKTSGSGPVPSPPNHTFCEADLRRVMDSHCANHKPHALAWQVYLLLATRFKRDQANRTTTGLMFDRDPKDRYHRQGAAVFLHDLCTVGETHPSDNTIRTIVHELGHCFNLLHTFERGTVSRAGRASTSYMNYPDKFAGGSAAYWDRFGWSFDAEELDFIRHGHLEQVIMGGSQFGHGAHSEEPCALLPESDELDIRLRLCRKPNDRGKILDFGEPVRIEAKLENLCGRPQPIPDALDPAHRQTLYLIRKPSGKVVRFRPLFVRCSESRLVTPSTESPAIYEDVHLTYGGDGFYFMDPGEYQIQAVATVGDRRVYSNLLRIWVRYPDRETEDLVVPTFEDAVGEYLCVWGDVELEQRVAVAENLRGERSDHPLAQELKRCQVYSRLSDRLQVRCEDGETRIESISGDKNVVKELRELAGLGSNFKYDASQKSTSPFSNIIYTHLVGTLAELLQKDGRQTEAEATLRSVKAYHRRHNEKKLAPAVVETIHKRWLGKASNDGTSSSDDY